MADPLPHAKGVGVAVEAADPVEAPDLEKRGDAVSDMTEVDVGGAEGVRKGEGVPPDAPEAEAGKSLAVGSAVALSKGEAVALGVALPKAGLAVPAAAREAEPDGV